MSEALKKYATLNNLTFVLASVQFVWLVWFFYTGLGGALELVARVMSIALALQVLFMYQQDYLYKWLPPIANHLLVAVYLGICAYAFFYFHYEFERIAIYSQGIVHAEDYIVGLLVFLLVMELSRLAHPILFWTNVFMVVYTLWGFLSPIDFFWHPGTSFHRVVTSSTVEFSTGIYGIYGQLALTLIAAFLLLAGVANGFNAQHSMINVVRLIARSRRLIPQTAVVGSSAIGLISGSGSANAAVVGTITIPLMMRYGVPGTFAAAVETAASMGGLIDAADDGRRRLPDGGVPGRALLGCRAARLCACLRLLHLDRRCGVSAVRAPAAGRHHRPAAGAALRQGHDRHLLRVRALSRLSDGLRRQGRIAGRALYRNAHAGPADPAVPLLQVCGERAPARATRRCSAASGAESKPMPR